MLPEMDVNPYIRRAWYDTLAPNGCRVTTGALCVPFPTIPAPYAAIPACTPWANRFPAAASAPSMPVLV